MDILKNHEVAPIDSDARKAIDAIISGAEKNKPQI